MKKIWKAVLSLLACGVAVAIIGTGAVRNPQRDLPVGKEEHTGEKEHMGTTLPEDSGENIASSIFGGKEGSSGEGFQKDTSEGTYWAHTGVEMDGWFYYFRGDLNEICRQKADGSGSEEVFIAVEGDGRTGTGMMMTTEQYFYQFVSDFGRYYLEQYTQDGRKTGSLEVPTSLGKWSQGYYYYTDDLDADGYRLYRIKGTGDGQPELLSEDDVVRFQICKEALYYTIYENDAPELMCCGLDGSSRRVMGEVSRTACYGLGTNVFYKEGNYVWYKDPGSPATVLCRIGMDGSEEVVLSGEEYCFNESLYPVAAGSWVFYDKSEKTGIDNPAYRRSYGVFNLDTGEEHPFPEEQTDRITRAVWPVDVQDAARLYFADPGGVQSYFSLSTEGTGLVEYGGN